MSVSAAYFKARCLQLMDDVKERRATYVITKRGRPVARLVPVEPGSRTPVFGRMKGTATVKGDLVAPVSVPWDAERDR
ncbi:MAG: type II toxin-antitoxin system Phd/YefM family antitoxin [Elusimicrobia bacterium]|nr:type II toxin-antitoxin system Phd/YefM family antitoxin [Elusimicrobiota bacterium]